MGSPLATVTSVVPRRNLDRFSVWPVTTERTGHQTATFAKSHLPNCSKHCCVARRAIGNAFPQCVGEREESFLAKWHQQRAQGRRSRVTSRVSPQRRTVRPRRNLSFVCTRTESSRRRFREACRPELGLGLGGSHAPELSFALLFWLWRHRTSVHRPPA
jgi:hypothetical protein